MELKTYQAPSMSDALARVKADLGRSAVILHTRSIRRGGLLGVGGRTVVEITATSDARVFGPQSGSEADTRQIGSSARFNGQKTTQPQANPAVAAYGQDAGGKAAPPTLTEKGISPTLVRAPRENPPDESRPGLDLESAKIRELEAGLTATEAAVQAEVQEIRAMLDGLLKHGQEQSTPPVPAELLEYHTKLISQHVAGEIVQEILNRVGSRLMATAGTICPPDGTRGLVEAELLRVITDLLPAARTAQYLQPEKLNGRGTRPQVIALVGPTGVGKTTTIAKLAANLKLREGRKVGLITIDTYRIAAVEQLKTYGQILKIPLIQVLMPSDIHAAMEQMADMDVVLIDTAGRSQRDELRIAELAEFLDAAGPSQVHLVLSGTTSEASIREAIAKFAPAGANHVIFTKLDEAVGFGVILNVLRDANLKLSYLTTGQSVPDDIEPAEGARVARLILSGCVHDVTHNDPAQPKGGRS